MITFQCIADRIANIETSAGTAQIPILIPAPVPVHLVVGIESPFLNQTCRQAQRHGRVICPLPGLQAEGSAADHIRHFGKGAARLELYGCADGISNCETKKAAAKAIWISFHCQLFDLTTQ